MPAKASRKPIPRAVWKKCAKQTAARGKQLPQTKLRPVDIRSIRSAQKQRENLLTYIRENLSNEALAKAKKVHVRTIEKVLSRETGSHVA